MDLTEEQWNIVKEYLPVDPRRSDGRGIPWKEPRVPAHLGFACRVTINKNELGFLRLRATDARGNDLLSPVFCSDSTGAHVVFQHWQYPLEEVKTLYHGYFDQKSSVSKTVSRGVVASRPGQKRALGNMGIDKGL